MRIGITGEVKTESEKNRIGLLVAGDCAPAIVTNQGAAGPVVIVCDHAGRAVPTRLQSLGLPPEAFDRHIAWDIGAGEVSRRLGEALGACVIRQTYSRLVVDCNRAPDRSDLIVETSDGATIPANAALGVADRAARLKEIHEPYHLRIAAELDRRAMASVPTAMVAVHSFTPELNGQARPWTVGVLHMGDSALSHTMLDLLAKEDSLVVGDNQPYVMDEVDYTIPRHAQARGLDYLEIEIRQDLIADPEGQSRITALLARLLTKALVVRR